MKDESYIYQFPLPHLNHLVGGMNCLNFRVKGLIIVNKLNWLVLYCLWDCMLQCWCVVSTCDQYVIGIWLALWSVDGWYVVNGMWLVA